MACVKMVQVGASPVTVQRISGTQDMVMIIDFNFLPSLLFVKIWGLCFLSGFKSFTPCN